MSWSRLAGFNKPLKFNIEVRVRRLYPPRFPLPSRALGAIANEGYFKRPPERSRGQRQRVEHDRSALKPGHPADVQQPKLAIFRRHRLRSLAPGGSRRPRRSERQPQRMHALWRGNRGARIRCACARRRSGSRRSGPAEQGGRSVSDSRPHSQRTQTAASMGIILDKASPSEAPRARPRTRRGEHLVAADAGAVVAVSEQHGRRGFDYSRRTGEVIHPVHVNDIGAPTLKCSERLKPSHFGCAPGRRGRGQADRGRVGGESNSERRAI